VCIEFVCKSTSCVILEWLGILIYGLITISEKEIAKVKQRKSESEMKKEVKC